MELNSLQKVQSLGNCLVCLKGIRSSKEAFYPPGDGAWRRNRYPLKIHYLKHILCTDEESEFLQLAWCEYSKLRHEQIPVCLNYPQSAGATAKAARDYSAVCDSGHRNSFRKTSPSENNYIPFEKIIHHDRESVDIKKWKGIPRIGDKKS